ncbi:hypothetical protein [Yinghuangia seranimata]|uniref:hypothetical protein n=1 Tax=Yinghuangia seranimata TaxID=408067 RepID=UPI00248CB19C|nr:hypothetical protein [Yinghuangia seranimata]MDI2125343.1 hypothetical protein [Yinghuangia seranimata]
MSDTDSPAAIRTGARLRSQVCATEVIVVRPPAVAARLELTCGGSPMLALGAEVPEASAPDPELAGGALLGKRYTLADDDTFELLVTKAGAGTLANVRDPLVLKEAKALPASD